MSLENYLDQKGRIFDIQKYSRHDGPGIRTIVFLKGCYLRCRWCFNPESQEYDIQNMTVAGKTKVIGKDVTVREIMPELLKDMQYYRRSGGGVTLSGGESLLQPEFAVGLLKACKDYGINTAMESTGFAPFEEVSAPLTTDFVSVKAGEGYKSGSFENITAIEEALSEEITEE